METFIKQLAKHISDNYPDLSKLTLVLPSQRAVKYIQKALHEIYQRPFFSPNFITIDVFARSFVDEESVDQVELLFRFYKIYVKLGNNDDFETFLNWAPLLIADCNDIDRYLVDANQLFKNLRDVRELEQWSFGEGRELSESQKQFLDFWNQLKDYYHSINENLAQDGLAYSGAIMRKAVLQVFARVDEIYPGQHFIFAGFNALSEAELQIMSSLVKLNRAAVILEADRFYLENKNHEAGLFIRKTKERIPEAIILHNDALQNSEKEMTITSCAQAGSMLKVTQNLLSEMSREELNHTVLLLADESLIVPAIKHIPKSVEVANITLGLPLKLTALRPWIEHIFEFQRNFDYFKTDALYHKTITAFLKHPFVELLLTDIDRELIQKEESNIIRFNKIFTKLKLESFSDNLRQVLEIVLRPWKDDFVFAIEQIQQLNTLIFDVLDSESHLLERSALFHFHDAVKSLSDVFQREDLPVMTLRSFEKFFTMRWIRESVAYYGNPIEGLQVMGMLETRMLDFKKLIVVGLNEGVLPPVNSINSLIPLDLRRYFGLPLPADKDAIFAHHFYRLLSGAENIHVLYSTNQGDDLAAAEPSRYLQQIELELKPVSKLRITHNTYNIPVSESISALSFSNSEEVRARILAYFQRGLSPSAMSKFLKCPMDFYVRYVLKYSDDEDVEEDIEHSTFGSVVHNTLEKLYTPFIGEVRPVLVEDIDRMLEICDSEVEVQFKNKFETSVDVFDRGAMYFALLAAKKQVRRFLKYERNLLKENHEQSLYIVSLEKKYEKELSIEVNGKRESIKLLGNIDRVDRFGGKLRIVDYKTGKCEAFQVTIGGKSCENISEALQNLDAYDFESMKHLDQHYVLQLLVYLVLYYENQKEIPDAIGIISMRNLNDGLQQLKIKPKSNSPVSQEISVDEKLAEFTTCYLAHLAELIMKIERFEHNPKSKYCLLCQG